MSNKPANGVYHVAPSSDSKWVAVGAANRTVQVWDVEAGACHAEFDTVMSFGGNRLAMSPDGVVVFAAAWTRLGVGAYAAADGTSLWQNRAVKHTQEIIPDGQHAYCCLEGGPTIGLALADGSEVRRLRGVRSVVLSPYAGLAFYDMHRPELRRVDGDRVSWIPRTTFAILSAAFGPRHLATSESGGAVRFFDVETGGLAGQYTPPRNRHVLQIAYSEAAGEFMGLEWDYARGGPKRLLRFHLGGADVRMVSLVGSAICGFRARGNEVVTGDGMVIDVRDGSTMRAMPFGWREGREPSSA